MTPVNFPIDIEFQCQLWRDIFSFKTSPTVKAISQNQEKHICMYACANISGASHNSHIHISIYNQQRVFQNHRFQRKYRDTDSTK